MPSDKSYRAVVEKIIPDGRHGPYVVTRSDEVGTITFALDKAVWQEEDRPEPGMHVVLSQLRRKRAGWRAYRGRFVTPSDEQPSNQQAEKRNQR